MRLLFAIVLIACQIVGSVICYGQSAKIDSLKNAFKSAGTESEKVENLTQLSQLLSKTDMMQALSYSERAVEILKGRINDHTSAKAMVQLGNMYFHLSNFPKALDIYQRVIQQKAALPDANDMLISAYGNIGSIYYYQRDLKEALDYYQLALNLYSEVPEANKKAEYYARKSSLVNNIGIIYAETSQLKEAEQQYRKALELSHLGNDSTNIGNVLNNLGNLFRDQGQLELARDFYYQGLAIRKAHNNLQGLARSYFSLGEFYFENQKDHQKSESSLITAIRFGSEIKHWQTVSSAYHLLYQLYKEQSKHKEALVAHENYVQMLDSLHKVETKSKISKMEMQFAFDKIQTEQSANQKERELYFWMSVGGVSFLLIIVSLLFILQRSKMHRAALEQKQLSLESESLRKDLEIKDKELATNIMYLINKNQLINEVSEKLLEIKNNTQQEDQKSSIQRLLIELQSNLQPELWNEFEYRFQQVHERFYSSLTEKFPDLSPSERRLCAFLKLNMTTKEISAITHQNAKSIDVARTRLRKKLNLTGTDHNLITFLEQLG